ncbi:MAG TPA: 4Fe-4S binding protein [Acidobacteriaceae bacterium]|nr:4Fe-4S binding protein [Acidobacteriaceae bacterium]
MSLQALEPATEPQHPRKKPVIRRSAPDRSQAIRRIAQWIFVALNAWIGIQFYFWVRWFERGGAGWQVARPAGVEGWLPIAGLMNLKYFAVTGHVPPIHPAAMFLLIAFLLMSVLAKKAFCAWLCPVGTFSEYLWKFGRKVFGRNLRPPRWLDIPLRGLKYLLLGFFVYVIASMSAEALAGFMLSPYGLITDVKMLDFFRTLSVTGIIVLAVLGLLSMLIQNFWCRYLCPYGALMGLVSLVSPLKIRRDPGACIECGKCARVCPSHFAVDKLVQIRSVECSACMACIAACPVEHGLQFAALPRKSASVVERWRGRIAGPRAVAAMLAVLFLGMVFAARATGHWRMHLPESVYMQLVPNASQVGHPGMDGPGSTMAGVH